MLTNGKIILSALQLRLNPPTTQPFIEQLCVFLPTMVEKVESDVFSREIFYTELSTYDFYRFLHQSNGHTAIGSTLNAIFDCHDDGKLLKLCMQRSSQRYVLNLVIKSTCVRCRKCN